MRLSLARVTTAAAIAAIALSAPAAFAQTSPIPLPSNAVGSGAIVSIWDTTKDVSLVAYLHGVRRQVERRCDGTRLRYDRSAERRTRRAADPEQRQRDDGQLRGEFVLRFRQLGMPEHAFVPFGQYARVEHVRVRGSGQLG